MNIRSFFHKIHHSALILSIIRWFDSEADIQELQGQEKTGIDWPRILPFIILHVMCLGVFWVGWRWIAVATALFLYVVRMFAITGFYHRYFSHKAFRTNRFWQFVFAVLGNSSAQRGPLWRAAHHRHHHRFAEQQEDTYSPVQHGFWWSHLSWLTSQNSTSALLQSDRVWRQRRRRACLYRRFLDDRRSDRSGSNDHFESGRHAGNRSGMVNLADDALVQSLPSPQ